MFRVQSRTGSEPHEGADIQRSSSKRKLLYTSGSSSCSLAQEISFIVVVHHPNNIRFTYPIDF